MPTTEQINLAAEKLLSSLELPDAEVAKRLRQAFDQEYWRALSPGMGVLAPEALERFDSGELTAEEESAAAGQLARHGYFRMPALTSIEVIDRMARSVEAVRAAGWPAVFTYVYDDFWSIFRTPPMVQFLAGRLGASYVQTAPVWTYHVDPGKAGSGWSPHVDSGREERLTVWIPLTESTIGNGCMYVIPRDRVPRALPDNFLEWSSVSAEQLGDLLHNVTPLPAAPGAVLGWNHSVIHWGGAATDAASAPRISIAVEFLREGATPRRKEIPVIDARLPSFEVRLRTIGQAMLEYGKFEPMMRRYRALAKRIVASASSQGSERA